MKKKEIPFGKFKGQSYKILLEKSNKDYVIWMLENCEETIKKFPDFHKFLLEDYPNSLYEEEKESNFSERYPSKFKELNGVLIETFLQYRELCVKVYSENWSKVNDKILYKTFGKPEKYPFIAFFMENQLDGYRNKELVKVYLNDKASILHYSESCY